MEMSPRGGEGLPVAVMVGERKRRMIERRGREDSVSQVGKNRGQGKVSQCESKSDIWLLTYYMYILQPSGSPPSSPLFTPKRVHARSSRFWETDESSCTESDAEEGDTSTLAIIVIRTLPGAAVGQLVTLTHSLTLTHTLTHSQRGRKD